MRGAGRRGRHGILIDLIPPVGEPGNGGSPRYPDDGWGIRGEQQYPQHLQHLNNNTHQYRHSREPSGSRTGYHNDEDMDWTRRVRGGHRQPRGLIGLIPLLLEAQSQSRPSPHTGYPGATSTSYLQPPSTTRPRSRSSPDQTEFFNTSRFDRPSSHGRPPLSFSNQANQCPAARTGELPALPGLSGRRDPRQQNLGPPPPYAAAPSPDGPPPSYEASRRDRRYT